MFCADYGDFSGEHAQIAKGGAFYDCLTRVPLILSWPGQIPQGMVDESCVNLIDIIPTAGTGCARSMQGKGLPRRRMLNPEMLLFRNVVRADLRLP